MRFEIFSHSLKAAALASLALSLGAGSALAQAANELPADREEIIITHQRLGPLSDWAAMQQHSADYQRLKAKYDPTTGSSHTDNWASDRNLAWRLVRGDLIERVLHAAPADVAVYRSGS